MGFTVFRCVSGLSEICSFISIFDILSHRAVRARGRRRVAERPRDAVSARPGVGTRPRRARCARRGPRCGYVASAAGRAIALCGRSRRRHHRPRVARRALRQSRGLGPGT